jgi:acyl-CoA reductase-like NAD-dependent aldehyde dehydrogenase
MSLVSLLNPAAQFLAQDPIPLSIAGQPYRGSAGIAEVFDPATGKAIARVSMANPSDVDAAVKAAESASPAWGALSVHERAVKLHRFADLLERHAEILAQLESLDVGKAIAVARAFDIPFGIACFRYFADLSVKVPRDVPLAVANIEARQRRAPYGVCGFVFPWNFPFTLLCWGIAPALAAGNTVVVKASEITPLASLYLAGLAADAGLPDGVINIVTGTGPLAGQPIAEHPLVRRMSFTGSTAVGKLIGEICGRRLVPVKLELGGKGAAVIFEDTEIEATAAKLAGALTLNTGQNCCMATRWFVHESIYDRFVEAVSAALGAIKIGPGLDETTQMGPLASAAHRERVLAYYDRGLSGGARALAPNARPIIDGPGYFVRPHLLAGRDDNVCFREEVFGPTAFVVKFKDEDEAVRRVNAVPYGLANSIWTADLSRADRMATRLIAGNNWINAHNVFSYGLPYGGVNLSGMGGGVNSPEAYLDYLRPTTIARPL